MSTFEATKDELDRFAELCLYHAQLAHLCFMPRSDDRTIYRDAFKALLDSLRYVSGDVPVVDRGTIGRRRREDADPPLRDLLERFARLEASGYAPRRFDRGLLVEAFLVSWRHVETVARQLDESLVPAADASVRYRVETFSFDYPRENVRPCTTIGVWENVSQTIAKSGAAPFDEVWPAYFHLFLFVDGALDRSRLQAIVEATNVALDAHAPALFGGASRFPPAARCRPLPLPVSARGALLASCYLNNPFKAYDRSNETALSYRRSGPPITEPAHALVRMMACEAASQLARTFRIDLGRTGSADQVYRHFLRAVRLDLFLRERVLVVPLAAVPEVGRRYPSNAWIEALARDFDSRSLGPEAVFRRYFAPARRSLDALRTLTENGVPS